MTSGQFEEAAQLAESEYLNGNANNPFWLTRQAAALSRAGRYEPALSLSRRAISLRACQSVRDFSCCRSTSRSETNQGSTSAL